MLKYSISLILFALLFILAVIGFNKPTPVSEIAEEVIPVIETAGEIVASSTEVERPETVSGPAPTTTDEVTAANILKAVNEERRKAGASRPVLVRNAALDRVAAARAEEMLRLGYFSHTSPTGRSFDQLATLEGYNHEAIGENLAVCCRGEQTTSRLMASWLASPLHYGNMLLPVYKETGIAIREGMLCVDPETRLTVTCTLVVQIFGTEK